MVFQKTKTSGLPSNQTITISQWDMIKSMENTIDRTLEQSFDLARSKPKSKFKQLTPKKAEKLSSTQTNFYLMPGKVDCTRSNEEIKTKMPEGGLLAQASIETPKRPRSKRIE